MAWVPGSRTKFENWTSVPSLYSWNIAESDVKPQQTKHQKLVPFWYRPWQNVYDLSEQHSYTPVNLVSLNRYNDLVIRYNDLVIRYNDLVIRYNNLVIRYNDLVIRYNDLVIRYNDLVIRYNDLAIRYNDLVIRYKD